MDALRTNISWKRARDNAPELGRVSTHGLIKCEEFRNWRKRDSFEGFLQRRYGKKLCYETQFLGSIACLSARIQGNTVHVVMFDQLD